MILPELSRSMLKNALVLGLFAIATVGVVTVLHQSTAERIQAAERAAQLRALDEVLPPGSYDNQLLNSSVEVHHPLLGTTQPTPAYIAQKNGAPSAIILQVVAPDGYSGAIHLLVGILADGSIAGVRTVRHRETPGLGDKIELAKDRWILDFDGKSLNNPQASGWAVKKDRGDFDQFAGATITPRAVVTAVHRALQYFEAHQEELLSATAGPVNPEQALTEPVEPADATGHTPVGGAAEQDDQPNKPRTEPTGDKP